MRVYKCYIPLEMDLCVLHGSWNDESRLNLLLDTVLRVSRTYFLFLDAGVLVT
jgi:hypothetical protein